MSPPALLNSFLFLKLSYHYFMSSFSRLIWAPSLILLLLSIQGCYGQQWYTVSIATDTFWIQPMFQYAVLILCTYVEGRGGPPWEFRMLRNISHSLVYVPALLCQCPAFHNSSWDILCILPMNVNTHIVLHISTT